MNPSFPTALAAALLAAASTLFANPAQAADSLVAKDAKLQRLSSAKAMSRDE